MKMTNKVYEMHEISSSIGNASYKISQKNFLAIYTHITSLYLVCFFNTIICEETISWQVFTIFELQINFGEGFYKIFKRNPERALFFEKCCIQKTNRVRALILKGTMRYNLASEFSISEFSFPERQSILQQIFAFVLICLFIKIFKPAIKYLI